MKFLVLPVVLLALAGCGEPSQKEKDQFAVDYCRERAVKDADGDKSVERCLLGACDILAVKYRQKYHEEP